MAARYWIGGTGNWNDPEHWSDTSGGIPYKPLSGVEKITDINDREFNIDTGWWLKGVGGIISNGNYSYSCTGAEYIADRMLKKSISILEYNKWYKVTVTLSIISGNVLLKTQNANNFTYITNGGICTNGVNVFYIYQQSPGNLSIGFLYYGTNPNGTIDNVSVMEVDTISPNIETDCIFDNNSGTGTVTVNAIANMRDCTFAQTQLITLANAAYAFNIYGNWTLCSNNYLNTSFTGTGYIYLKATTSVNITSNGCTRAWNRVFFDGVGGTWTNQDDWNTGAYIYLTNGEWNTNSKTIYAYFMVISVGTKKLTLGSSTLNLIRFYNYEPLNLIVDKGTSHIIVSAGTFLGGDNEYYNVTAYCDPAGDAGTRDATFNNLTVLTINVNNPRHIVRNVVINGVLTLNGSNNYDRRLFLYSSTLGTPNTITCNGTISASNVDFRDITLVGTANRDLSAITGSSGDCGGNSGITFTPAQTQYFKHTLGAVNWSDATKWFSSYERTIQGRVPLPQDDAIFDENSFTGASTLTVNVPRIGRSLNMEGVNQDVTFSLANVIECYGSFVLGNNITPMGNYRIDLTGRYQHIINTFQKTLYLIFTGVAGGNYKVQSNLVFTGYISARGGVLDFNNYNCTGSRPFDFDANFPKVYLRNGIFTGVENGAIYVLYCGNGTLYAGNSSIIIRANSSSNLTFRGGGQSFNIVGFLGSSTGNMDITHSNTFAELIIDSSRKVRFTNGTTQTIGKLTAIGTPDLPITIGSTTAGQRHTINYTGSEASTVEYCNISDSKVTQADKLYALNSVDGGNNVNWIFIVGYKMYSGANRVLKAYLGNTLLKNIYIGNETII